MLTFWPADEVCSCPGGYAVPLNVLFVSVHGPSQTMRTSNTWSLRLFLSTVPHNVDVAAWHFYSRCRKCLQPTLRPGSSRSCWQAAQSKSNFTYVYIYIYIYIYTKLRHERHAMSMNLEHKDVHTNVFSCLYISIYTSVDKARAALCKQSSLWHYSSMRLFLMKVPHNAAAVAGKYSWRCHKCLQPTLLPVNNKSCPQVGQ